MRRNRSPMMCSGEVGRKWWMSATRPASELSIGISARSACPDSTVANTSSKLAHATASASGKSRRHTRWEFEPGSPWYAMRLSVFTPLSIP